MRYEKTSLDRLGYAATINLPSNLSVFIEQGFISPSQFVWPKN